MVPGTKILEIKEELLLRVEPRCEPLVALTTSEAPVDGLLRACFWL